MESGFAKERIRGRARRFSFFDCCVAARDFILQRSYARGEFVRGKGRDILSQYNLVQLLPRQQFIGIDGHDVVLSLTVIPAKGGIQQSGALGPRFRGDDNFDWIRSEISRGGVS
jgi:hypothetical protein